MRRPFRIERESRQRRRQSVPVCAPIAPDHHPRPRTRTHTHLRAHVCRRSRGFVNNKGSIFRAGPRWSLCVCVCVYVTRVCVCVSYSHHSRSRVTLLCRWRARSGARERLDCPVREGKRENLDEGSRCYCRPSPTYRVPSSFAFVFGMKVWSFVRPAGSLIARRVSRLPVWRTPKGFRLSGDSPVVIGLIAAAVEEPVLLNCARVVENCNDSWRR